VSELVRESDDSFIDVPGEVVVEEGDEARIIFSSAQTRGGSKPSCSIVKVSEGKHVCQAKLSKFILVKNFQKLLSLMCTIFIFDGITGSKHHLNS